MIGVSGHEEANPRRIPSRRLDCEHGLPVGAVLALPPFGRRTTDRYAIRRRRHADTCVHSSHRVCTFLWARLFILSRWPNPLAVRAADSRARSNSVRGNPRFGSRPPRRASFSLRMPSPEEPCSRQTCRAVQGAGVGFPPVPRLATESVPCVWIAGPRQGSFSEYSNTAFR